MKNVLLFNYNIDTEDLIKVRTGVYSFYIDYQKFYFVKINRPLEDIKDIIEAIRGDRDFHEIIPNKFFSLFTEYEKSFYTLLKIRNPENSEIDIFDIIKNVKPYFSKNSNLNRTNWGELWENKVDYLEYQVSEFSTTHDIVRKSFSYYVGLAENAITYFNMLSTESAQTVLSHRRMKYPLISKNFYNPLDLVVDYKVRDYALYFKVKFFNESSPIEEVKILANKNILTSLEYNLLFCRLLYPSYYFDALYNIFEENEDDNILLKYIEKVKEYEEFLKKTYIIFKEKSSMIKIDWLIKKL